MTSEDFAILVDKIQARCKQVLLEKNHEYSRAGDRLWNFKVAGRKRDRSPEDALLDMQCKHAVSIEDIVNDVVVRGKDVPPLDKILEKVVDDINYDMLLVGLLVDRAKAQGDWKDEDIATG
jgi:hypothetical protein